MAFASKPFLLVKRTNLMAHLKRARGNPSGLQIYLDLYFTFQAEHLSGWEGLPRARS
jgi:hypothetical protein